jgi:hypothetical protein
MSMAKYKLKQKAISLRLKGMSYNQIRTQIKVSKSSLSLWLKEYPLSEERLRSLRDFSEVRIEKYRRTMLAKRENRFAQVYKQEKIENLPLSKRELFIAGLFLYWGEGLKGLKNSVGFYNTNPQMIKFGLFWYTKILGIPKNAVKIYLHLYSDMNIKEEISFWSNELKLPLSQFYTPYIKKTKKADITNKGAFGHGTCGLIFNDVFLKEKIMAAIAAIADFYENRI